MRLVILVSLTFFVSSTGFASFVPVEKEWTLLVYGAGDEIEVQDATRLMLKRIEETSSLRPDGEVRVVAQHDDVGKDQNLRYLLGHVKDPKPGTMPTTPALTEEEITEQLRVYDPKAKFKYRELDSGSPLTLKEFIRWGVRSFPARHYMLVLGGHSWGQQGLMQDFFVNDTELESSTMIKNYELRRLMEEIYREEKAKIPQGIFDVLLVDGCTSGQLDVVLEFKDVFKYFAGSSLETPFNSLPYDQFLQPFVQQVSKTLTSTAATKTKVLEDSFFKPFVTTYIQSHVRGGSLVKVEGQLDIVEAFVIRNSQLQKVADALKALVASLPKEAVEAWRAGKLKTVELVNDTDANGDLLQLTREFLAYFIKKDNGREEEKWVNAQQAAKQLGRTLGYPANDPAFASTEINFKRYDTSIGVWAHLQIDEVVKLREAAACTGLKHFAMLNAWQPDLVPEFTKKRKPVTAQQLRCNELGEAFLAEHPGPDEPWADGPHPLTKIFGHKVAWNTDIQAYLTELRDPKDAKQVLKRVLSIWIPRPKKDVLSVRLRLPATEVVKLDFLAAGRGKSETLFIEEPEKHATLRIGSANFKVASYHAVTDFPADALYVAEGHSNGAHFKQGMGIYFARDLEDSAYQGGRLPIEKVEAKPFDMSLETYFADLRRRGELERHRIKGIDFYRAHRIEETQWPQFLFGKDDSWHADKRPSRRQRTRAVQRSGRHAN